MSRWDNIFWLWFIVAGFLLVYSTFYEYSLMTIIFSINIIGFGLLKLSQEKEKRVKISRKLLDKLKSI